FFFQAEDGIRDGHVTGVQTCALPIFAPVVAVVTTIDREHLDQYTSLEDIQDAFTQFVNRVPFYGAAILCVDEPNVQAIIPNVKRSEERRVGKECRSGRWKKGDREEIE